MHGPPPRFTVAICAFNARQRIGLALDALAAMRYAGPWEVLVIDNASTDGSGEHVLQWRGRLPRLRVLREAQPGVGHARARAFREAAGEFVCFVDDDNLLAPDYLAQAEAVLQSHQTVGMVCGRSELHVLGDVPDWFAEVGSCYAVGQAAACDGILPPGQVLWSAGLVVRRAAFAAVEAQGFAPQLVGRLGSRQLAGEDAEFCLAMMLAGWQAYACNAMVMGHAIDPGRMSLQALRRTAEGFGAASIVLETYRSFLQGPLKGRVKRSDLLFGLLLCVQLGRAGMRRVAQRSVRSQVGYWSAWSALRAYALDGLRPGRVLRSTFLQQLSP